MDGAKCPFTTPMSSPTMISRNALCLVLTLSPLLLGITDAAGADAQVYKCAQPNGTALYTDRACKGGTAVDIRLGPADPAAPARLAHAQAELDAAAAQRTAEEEMAVARREGLNRLQLGGRGARADSAASGLSQPGLWPWVWIVQGTRAPPRLAV